MSEKTNAIIKQLHDGVEAVFESEKFKEYLKFLASFRQYSFGNTLLIMLQKPDASYVASFSDWKNKHHRIVKKGEKGLKIIAPHVYTEKREGEDDVQRIGYHLAYCFDISQTEPDALHADTAEDIPDICRTIDVALCDRDYNLFDVLKESVCPVPVSFGKIKGKANGYYDPENLQIVLNEKIQGKVQAISTLLHEASHAWLHCNDGTEKEADKATKEVQAQAVAYVVASYIGYDVSDYSFEYIGSWSKDRTHKELTNSLDVIRKTSNEMIERIEERLMKDVA